MIILAIFPVAHRAVSEELAVGEGLHLVELGDVVEDGEEDDGEDIDIPTTDLERKEIDETNTIILCSLSTFSV